MIIVPDSPYEPSPPRKIAWIFVVLLIIGAGVAVIGRYGALATHWLNEDNAAQNAWESIDRNSRYTNQYGQIIAPFILDTNVTLSLGFGTNRVRI
jgi:hypothetical protein